MKSERLVKLQKELSSEQSRFTTFEFSNKQRILESEMQIEHYESENESLAMKIVNRKRDLEFKGRERDHAAAELSESEQYIDQARSLLVNQAEKIKRLKENINT